MTPALVSEIFLGMNSLRNEPATLLAHVLHEVSSIGCLQSLTEQIDAEEDPVTETVVWQELDAYKNDLTFIFCPY